MANPQGKSQALNSAATIIVATAFYMSDKKAKPGVTRIIDMDDERKEIVILSTMEACALRDYLNEVYPKGEEK